MFVAKGFVLIVVLILVGCEAENETKVLPPYIKQCYEGDPELIKCFIGAIHRLKPYLKTGIEEIELPSVEPFKMGELELSLTTGPNGYKVTLKDIDVFGASNFTTRSLRLSEDNRPFEVRIFIPHLKIHSRYESSGMLFILPASGNGTFNGQLEGLDTLVRGRVTVHERNGGKYLRVDHLSVDLVVKDVHLMVKNIFRNNVILTQAINLFLRESGMEVFKIMLPQLKKKLSSLFASIANSLLSHVPLHDFYVPKKQ